MSPYSQMFQRGQRQDHELPETPRPPPVLSPHASCLLDLRSQSIIHAASTPWDACNGGLSALVLHTETHTFERNNLTSINVCSGLFAHRSCAFCHFKVKEEEQLLKYSDKAQTERTQ